MRLRSFALILFTVFLAGSLPVDRALAGEKGKSEIAFISDRDGGGLYVMDADGGNVRMLYQSFFCLVPSWSPDGGRIAFFGLRTEDEALLENYQELQFHFLAYLIDPDGKNLTLLTKAPVGAGTLEWSPDGKKIAFISAYEQREYASIYVIDSSGRNQRRLTEIDGNQSHPRWSPDGRRILFTCNKKTAHRTPRNVFVINEDGSGLTQVTQEELGAHQPAWSPDGKRIAYRAVKNRSKIPVPTQIMMIDADGSNRRVVGDIPGEVIGWTPDGKSLLVRYRKLRLLDIESGKAQELCKGIDRILEAVLSPAGDRVLFSHSQSKDIHMLTIADGTIRNLTNSPANDGAPCWGPRPDK
jgi:TolB protein